MSDERKDFTYLVAGDGIVFDDGNHWGRSVTVRTVKKVTATQIVLNNDLRFRRDSGDIIGRSFRSFSFPKLRHVTTELLESIEHARIVKSLGSTKWESLPLGVLRDVEVMMRKHPAPSPQLPPDSNRLP